MTVTINGTTGIVAPAFDGAVDAADLTGTVPSSAVPYVSGRNRIINGAMTIDQRNAGAAVTFSGSNIIFVSDRFNVGIFGTTYSNPTMTAQQVTDAPSGYTNSLKVTSSSTVTPDTNKLGSWFQQKIEGFNVLDLAWGTAAASAVTVQFRVKASKTGAISVSIENSANDRSYVTTVTISAANTWETKTVTIPGDTSGTWLTNNGTGLSLQIGIMSNGSWLAGAGGAWSSTRALLSTSQTNFIATSGDYIAITGVQLEAGSIATTFERRLYGQELALCQRYCYVPTNAPSFSLAWITGAAAFQGGNVPHPQIMRAAPTVSGVTSFTIQGITSSAVGFSLSGTNQYLGLGSANSNSQGDGVMRSVNANQVPVISAEL